MSDLDQAAINFFAEIAKVARELLGHTEFQFRIDAQVGVKPDNAEIGKEIGARIQHALDAAQKATKPITIDGKTN